MQSRKSIKPVILVGGKGKRLGKNKALISIDGESVLRKTVFLLEEIFETVPLLIGDNSEINGFPVIPDVVKGAGPLGGLYTAFLHTDAKFIFLTACDMPFIKRELLIAMKEKLPPCCDVFVPYYRGFTEPLFAFYSRRLLGSVEEIISLKKYFPVRKIFSFAKVLYFDEREIVKYDPEFLTFININTKEDYELAKRIASAS